MPLNYLHPQPVLRRIVFPATPGASTNVDLPCVQQDREFRGVRGRLVCEP